MAVTDGVKKLGVMVLVAAVLGGGGFYFYKNPPKILNKTAVVEQAKPEVTPAVEETKAKKSNETIFEATDRLAVEADKRAGFAPVKKQHVAKVATKKKAHRSSESRGGSVPEPTHKTLEKELTSDQKALQGLAGDKL